MAHRHLESHYEQEVYVIQEEERASSHTRRNGILSSRRWSMLGGSGGKIPGCVTPFEWEVGMVRISLELASNFRDVSAVAKFASTLIQA